MQTVNPVLHSEAQNVDVVVGLDLMIVERGMESQVSSSIATFVRRRHGHCPATLWW
jgi:hypothetical protein